MLSYRIRVKTSLEPKEAQDRYRTTLLALYEKMQIPVPERVHFLLNKKKLETTDVDMLMRNEFTQIPSGEVVGLPYLEDTATVLMKELYSGMEKTFGKPLQELPKVVIKEGKNRNPQRDSLYNYSKHSIEIESQPAEHQKFDNWTKPYLMYKVAKNLAETFVSRYGNGKNFNDVSEDLEGKLLEHRTILAFHSYALHKSLALVTAYNVFRTLPASSDVLKCISNYEWSRIALSTRDGWTPAFGPNAERVIPTFENLINQNIQPYQLSSVDLGYYKPNQVDFKVIVNPDLSKDLEAGLKNAKIPFKKILQ